jgi:putative oxidoreductase
LTSIEATRQTSNLLEAMKVLRLLTNTTDTIAPLISRVTLGLVMFPHGAQKMLGWYGGHGFSGTLNYFTGTMHIPAFLALLAILAEFAGAIGLVLGLLSRLAALGIASVMTVAILMVHAANGFFMNWGGSQKGEGFEYHVLALGLALVVLVQGGGKASVDSLITRRLNRPHT